MKSLQSNFQNSDKNILPLTR